MRATGVRQQGRFTWHWSFTGEFVGSDGFALTRRRALRKIAKWRAREDHLAAIDYAARRIK